MFFYLGFFGIWDYVKDVRCVLFISFDVVVKVVEDEVCFMIVDGVNCIGVFVDEYFFEGVECK